MQSSPVTPRNPPQPAPEPILGEPSIHHHSPDYLASPEAAVARVEELTHEGQRVCDERDALRQEVEEKDQMLHSAESQHLDL
jgi:hypothetical protein